MTLFSTLRALSLVSFGLAASFVSAGGPPQPGDLDVTFSGDGWMAPSVTANNDGADIGALPDGRLVFVIAAASTPDLVAVGVSSGDGAASDGNGFILDLGTGPIATVPTALAVQPDGKVVIVGRTGENPSRAFVLRVVIGTAFDITVDGGFGTNGWTVLSAAQSLRLNDVVLDGNGRIVAAGGADLAGGDTDFLVVRLTATGQPDNTFDGDGRKTISFGGATTFPEEATAVAIDASFRVVVAGRAATLSAAGGEFAVCRLLGDQLGAFDNTFSGDGRLLVGFDLGGDKADEADGLALDAQGRILVAGRARDSDGSGHVAALLRLTGTGVLDTDFSTDGRVTSLFGLGGANDSALGKDVLATREGTVLLLGERLTLDLTSSDLGLSAFDANGNADTTYGFLGSRIYNLGGYETMRNATLSAGRPLVMGDQNTAGLIVRLHRDQIFADGFESTDTSEWTLSVP